jgi:hypothetical protein
VNCNTQNEELIRIHIIICVMLPVYISVYLVQEKRTDYNGKHLYKVQFLGCRNF